MIKINLKSKIIFSILGLISFYLLSLIAISAINFISPGSRNVINPGLLSNDNVISFEKPVYISTDSLDETQLRQLKDDNINFYFKSAEVTSHDYINLEQLSFSNDYQIFINSGGDLVFNDSVFNRKCSSIDGDELNCDLTINGGDKFFKFDRNLFLQSYSGLPGYTSSDSRLKENIKPLESVLDRVLKLKGIEFEWKSNGKKSYGVNAEEIEKIFPELINQIEGVKYVNYKTLIPILIAAQKEQLEIIKNQDAEYQILEN